MNKATKLKLKKIVEARVNDTALELGVAEIFDKIGKGNDPEMDRLIQKEKAIIAEFARKVILETFGGNK